MRSLQVCNLILINSDKGIKLNIDWIRMTLKMLLALAHWLQFPTNSSNLYYILFVRTSYKYPGPYLRILCGKERSDPFACLLVCLSAQIYSDITWNYLRAHVRRLFLICVKMDVKYVFFTVYFVIFIFCLYCIFRNVDQNTYGCCYLIF